MKLLFVSIHNFQTECPWQTAVCNYDLSWFYNNQRETYTDGGKLYRKLPFHRLANDTFSGYIWATLLFCHLNYTFSTGGKIFPRMSQDFLMEVEGSPILQFGQFNVQK